MGGGILSKLLSKVDDAAYSGVQSLGKYPNGVGMGRGTLKQKAIPHWKNFNDVFSEQSLAPLARKSKLKIRDTGGGGAPLLQDFYEVLTGRR